MKQFLEGLLVTFLVIFTKNPSRNPFNVILMGKKINQEMLLLVTKVKMKNKSTYKNRIRKRNLAKLVSSLLFRTIHRNFFQVSFRTFPLLQAFSFFLFCGT